MTDRYQALRDAIAERPTPGPWRVGRFMPTETLMPSQVVAITKDGDPYVILGGNQNFPEDANRNARYAAAADPETIAALLAESDALRKLIAAGCLLSSVSEEFEFDDGMGRGAGLDYWHEFEEKLSDARTAIEGVSNAPL